MRKFLVGIFSLTLASCVGQMSFAQSSACGDHNVIEQALKDQYGETVGFIGLTNTGMVFEVYINEETSTFTIVLTRPGQPSCLVEAGEGWQAIPQGEVM